jgi:5-(carboxyamino)imidazole ribonucleotide mutase
MCASKTALPVLGVPVASSALGGVDSLLSILQMPGGVPVGTLAVGKPGAINAALLATTILGLKYPQFRKAYESFRSAQTEAVLACREPGKSI